MNRHVNAISGRLSLRPPQRRSLEILDRITEIVPPRKEADLATALEIIRSEFPTVTDFEREFPSLCFALATGVGKTRLMGAFISYLHLAHGINNFFVLAPNLTIYNKLIEDFSNRNHPKYVFKGIAEFASYPPEIITGDNYESKAGNLFDILSPVKVNIFNISKINSEVRGGKAPRIKRLSEYIGESYFDYLASLKDLVLLMDESHRYRASAGIRAINELKPIIGLELTATPFVETARGAVPFQNVIYDYPLATAMADGFVKEPAVVTQKNFKPSDFTPERLEEIKLEDGVRLHESVKVELETYARQTSQKIVKPFMLVIARDTTHARQLLNLIQSDKFFEGRYREKVIQVDSSQTGAAEEEMIQRLLAVESTEEPTEIVIHVNMLKEGWDVTNLYTIVPLRAANARILIEQSIGRGLRLPYGKKTGVVAVDRLNIVAHDRFQEIIDEANRAGSVIRLQQVILEPEKDFQKKTTVVSPSTIEQKLGLATQTTAPVMPGGQPAVQTTPVFTSPAEQRVAQVAYKVIQEHEFLPSSSELIKEEIAAEITRRVEAELVPEQMVLEGVVEKPDVAAIVAKTTQIVMQQSIDIPRILVVPKGEVTLGYHPFTLDAKTINFQPVSRDLLIKHLRTSQEDTLSDLGGIERENRLEDYLVRALIDFDDISYDAHADLLYDLSGQMVQHLLSYLKEDEARNVLQYYQRQLAEFIHAQMQTHQWESAVDYEVKISKGFSTLKQSAFTAAADGVRHFRPPVDEKSKIGQMVFGGFQRCLYPVQKFDSDTERRFSVILEKESDKTILKWFKPAKGQFQIYYKSGNDHLEYQPDFVVETTDLIYMVETKARNEMEAAEVLAKKEAAVKWCGHASDHNRGNGGKPWQYLMVPHDVVAENMTLVGLANSY
ncbi:MAG: DEAD/DEAH box helicase family protein [Desulforhabdus sp.]|jgi:type III restriction enzyme|nr:DEAD/DEAH box helicase family protein [Desulforhabdus sp.]